MEGYGSRSYGDAFADVYDRWYSDLGDPEGCVARLTALAGEEPVLELGVGTGRIALALAEQGLEVVGVDASPAMLARLGEKDRWRSLRVAAADMAELPLRPAERFGLVFVTRNTFFNLPSAAAQQRCVRQVSAMLRPGGRFALEVFVPVDEDPDEAPDRADATVVPTRMTADTVVLTATLRDRVNQTLSGQHIELAESGIRLRPWHLRYATPEEIDAMAATAGLALEARWGGWRGEAFDGMSTHHVSVYRRSSGAGG